MNLFKEAKKMEYLRNEIKALAKKIDDIFETRCLSKKHYFLQYGTHGHSNEFYIAIVKRTNRADKEGIREKKWITFNLYKFNFLTQEEEYFIDINKLRYKHRARLVKLATACKNRFSKEV